MNSYGGLEQPNLLDFDPLVGIGATKQHRLCATMMTFMTVRCPFLKTGGFFPSRETHMTRSDALVRRLRG